MASERGYSVSPVITRFVSKWRVEQRTRAHVRVAVFVGHDIDHLALSGTLTFRTDEWTEMRATLGRGSGWNGRAALVVFEDLLPAEAVGDEIDQAGRDHAANHPDPVPGCAICGVSEGDMV